MPQPPDKTTPAPTAATTDKTAGKQQRIQAAQDAKDGKARPKKKESGSATAAPGPVWTPLNPADRSVQGIVDFGKKTHLGRPAQPEEISPAYVFLAASCSSSYITGSAGDGARGVKRVQGRARMHSCVPPRCMQGRA